MTAPRDTFQYLGEHPDWVTPLVIISLSAIILSLTIFPKIFQDLVEIMTIPLPFAPWVGIAFGLALSPIMAVVQWLSTTLIIFLSATLLYMGLATFKEVLSITGYAHMPNLIKSLLTSGTVIATGRFRFSPGLTSLLSTDHPNKLLFALLASIDIFQLWTLFLVTLGIEAVYKMPRRRAIIVTLIPWTMSVAGLAVLG